MEVGDRYITAGPGSFVLGPRGVRHRFRVSRASARYLLIISPAGLEQYFVERNALLKEAGLADRSELSKLPPSSVERMAALSRKYGLVDSFASR